jgi:hypothetical protein
MRRPYFIFSIFTTLLLTLPLLTTVPAFSQATPATGTTARTAPAKAANTKPQIITDEKTNTVRILIGGKEVLTIDAKGLHVHGDIDYSGIITDTNGNHPKSR